MDELRFRVEIEVAFIYFAFGCTVHLLKSQNKISHAKHSQSTCLLSLIVKMNTNANVHACWTCMLDLLLQSLYFSRCFQLFANC